MLRGLYASFTRQFHFRRTGQESNYGRTGTEFQLWGGERDGRRYDSPMPAFARYLEEHQVDAELFLSHVFESWKGPKPPMVNQLMNPILLQKYRHYATRLDLHLLKMKGVYHDAYMQQFKINRREGHPPEQACLMAILHPALGLSVLYKFCVLTQGDYIKLTQQFRTTALLEYSPLRKHYDKAWSDLIPLSLRKAARDRLAGLGVE